MVFKITGAAPKHRHSAALHGNPLAPCDRKMIMGLPFRAAQYAIFWTMGKRAIVLCGIPARANG